MSRRRASLLVVATALAACGSPARPGAVTPKADPQASVRALEAAESEILRDLAALDLRIAKRTRTSPSEDDRRRVAMAAVLAEDVELAVVDGAIDPFSFSARGRGLAAAERKVAAAPRDLPQAGTSVTARPSLERELLVRLVDEELFRLSEDRAVPRSASGLVRAVVETWRPIASPAEAAERDRWLARRLTEISVEIGSPHAASPMLDVTRARELDDSLDALERLTESAGLAASTKALVGLRESVERWGRPQTPSDAWPALAKGLHAHLGLDLGADALDERLRLAESRLRADAESAVTSAHLGPETLGARVAAAMLEAPCFDDVAGSRLRSLSAPPERSAPCRLRHLAGAQADDAARAVALATLHDHVILARWALGVARGADLPSVTARHRPLSRFTPDVAARLERFAIVQPVSAIGGGYACVILTGGHVAARARAWSALGDVPLDIAERELAGR